jgi:hypothetical protein
MILIAVSADASPSYSATRTQVYDKRATGTSQVQLILTNTSNKNTLRLVVTDGGDGFNCDHADWAAARLIR